MQFTNYTPISILHTISKIFEKIIFKQLYQFFIDNKLLYNSKYAFREGHSTEYAALELVDRITLEMDNNNTPVNIFLDISKDFDTLNHQILSWIRWFITQTHGKLFIKQKTICRD